MKTDEVKKYLESIWMTPDTNDIDDTKPILVVLKNGDIRKCRYNKTNNTFYIENRAVIFKSDIIKLTYIENLINYENK